MPLEDNHYITESLDLRESGNSESTIRSMEIQERIDFLISLGFKEEWIARYTGLKNTLIHKEEALKKIGELKGLGFNDPIKLITSMPTIFGYNIESMKEKIKELKGLGFNDPIKLITSMPTIFGYNIESMKEKIKELKRLEFENPIKLITSSPAIFCYSIENIREKIEELKKLGFENPIKLITSSPDIFSYSIETIREKIEELKKLGFEDPIKLITSSPTIFGYNIESMREKIEELKRLGFENPIKLITSMPTIFGLNIEKNITPKIKILDYFIQSISLARTLIYLAPEILGTKKDKTWTIIRILRELDMLDKDITRYYKQINMLELESFIIISNELKNDPGFMTLGLQEKKNLVFSRIYQFRKKGTKEERKQQIGAMDPKGSKTVLRYLRGYN